MRRPERYGGQDVELVSDRVSDTDMQDEANRRTAKAGYTTRYGEPTYRTKIQSVGGFGPQRLNIWPRDENGCLIDD